MPRMLARAFRAARDQFPDGSQVGIVWVTDDIFLTNLRLLSDFLNIPRHTLSKQLGCHRILSLDWAVFDRNWAVIPGILDRFPLSTGWRPKYCPSLTRDLELVDTAFRWHPPPYLLQTKYDKYRRTKASPVDK